LLIVLEQTGARGISRQLPDCSVCIAIRQHALLHRVHGLTTWLFGLTAPAALTHLVAHTIWLSVVTTFLPALGASLHGALAQSEA